jgi:MerR family transcriptional regulator, thiopeptide resistance regulator
VNAHLVSALAEAKRTGVAAGSPEARALAARQRASIEQFYDREDAMQRCLAQLYVADRRFTTYYDAAEPGLGQYVHDVIVAGGPR